MVSCLFIDRANDEIRSEWLFCEPPATELGRLEAEFFDGRFDYVTEVPA